MTSADSPDHSLASGVPRTADGERVRAGWAPFLVPGNRVVLRHAIDRERSPHGESMSDALGTVEAVDDRSVTVMTRRGSVRVPRALVIAAKPVPPPPSRPGGRAAP